MVRHWLVLSFELYMCTVFYYVSCISRTFFKLRLIRHTDDRLISNRRPLRHNEREIIPSKDNFKEARIIDLKSVKLRVSF